MTYREKLQQFLNRHPYQNRTAGGAAFRYILEGSGPSVVFLNGGMNVSEMWMDYLDDLTADYQVLLFDYSRDCATNQQLVTAMHALFQELGVKAPVLVGASDGGMVAQIYTQKYPDEVGGLVLLSTGGMDERTLKSLKRKYFMAPLMHWYMKHTDYEKLKPKMIRMGVSHTKGEGPEAQAYAKEMFTTLMADYPKEKDLHITGLLVDLMNQTPVTKETFRRLKGRILLILPTMDFFSPKMQQDLIALMHEPQLRTIKGGHIATVLHPDIYLKEIRAFLKGLSL